MTKQKVIDYQNQLNLLEFEEAKLKKRLTAIKEEKACLNLALNTIKDETRTSFNLENNAPVNPQFTSTDKLAIFRDLFKGRPDVFPKRWENKPGVKAGGQAGHSSRGSSRGSSRTFGHLRNKHAVLFWESRAGAYQIEHFLRSEELPS